MSFKRGHLRYFVTVADEGQITRAAAKLHIAQPALSQAIAQLETELGVALLVRNARGVTLTSAGEAFLPKARAAVASEHDVELTGLSLARAARGTLDVGFVGPPPTMSAPELFASFAEAHPQAELAFRDLPFPRGTTLAWLQDVDVAFSHPPMIEPGVSVRAVRTEPRAVIVHRGHPLAQRAELTVADVRDETFISYHPDVQPAWAGFHTFDDHRGACPRSLTADHVMSSLQMLGTMSTRRAITTAPLSDARLAQQVLPDVVAIPVVDAEPAVLSFVWRTDTAHPLVQALVATVQQSEAP